MKINFQNNCRRPQRGIALVITLILLSVTLVMAVAFLFISRREQGSVTTETDSTTARYAADAALANAEAQIDANILSSSTPNLYNFGLLVSTNYINPNGFMPGFNNVNYNYDTNGTSLTSDEFLQNLTNLFYSPRPPVFISENGTNDFRYYLDLNRNGRYDTNGVTGDFDTNGFTGTTSFKVGDPEWIGVLEHPNQPYGPNNHFIARYAFFAVPVGNSLDLNAIHNQVFDENNASTQVNPPPANDGYFRNQGVGSWEMNLAGFLADLNTNEWGNVIGNAVNANTTYYYYQNLPGNNAGAAFDDARALLAFRYANNYSSLAPANNLFQNAATIFPSDDIDGYSDGPLQITTAGLNEAIILNQDVSTKAWSGADNTNHFFNLQSDLFDPAKTQVGVTAGQIAAGDYFSNHLAAAGSGGDTYDRYTFYRMLAELGTDTTPDSGRMNLNYDNLDASGNVIPGAETNFIQWTPLQFFTNAADRMLRAYTARWATTYSNDATGTTMTMVNTNFEATFNVTNSFGIGDIPVLVSNQFVYTPAVQRILQLAANIYDATTNNSANGSPDWPDVFRPIFSSDINGNVFITGYTNVTVMLDPVNDPQLNLPVDITTISGTNVLANVYGVPWIIGAKKGFPNFNQFAMNNICQVSRKLQFTRSSTNVTYISSPSSYTLSQQLMLAVTNELGIECWNSYAANFTNAVSLWVYDTNTLFLTNDENAIYSNVVVNGAITNFNIWPGSGNSLPLVANSSSFIVPLNTNLVTLPASVYHFDTGVFDTNQQSQFYLNYLQPRWTFNTANHFRVVMLGQDAQGYHIIDYVHLSGPNTSTTNTAYYGNDTGYGRAQWEVNSNAQGIPYGFNNQIGASLDQPTYYPNHVSDWGPDSTTVEDEIDGFRAFMLGPFGIQDYHNPGESNIIALARVSLTNQVPYTPSEWIIQNTTWQANDPLVHYIASDLVNLNQGSGLSYYYLNPGLAPFTFTTLNGRYMPWGIGFGLNNNGVDVNPYNMAYKDPSVSSSDHWDFPEYKLPTVGWIGRIHRGTPWQTVYLKSTNILTLGTNGFNTWVYWTGNGNGFDQTNTAPVEDRLLFDLFTTGFNDNATRGTLSVNVGTPAGSHNLAAWSALFSGVQVLSNNLPDSVAVGTKAISYTAFPIDPAGANGANSGLEQLAAGIDNTRTAFVNRDGLTGVFEHAGDILATPQLSDQSPFLHLLMTNGLPDSAQMNNGINDEMYEWLPQQTMSLVRVGSPRYVIYCYGQTLKPAQGGVYLNSGPYFGMVTNYQVTAESATRTVVRFTPTNAVIESFNILPPD